MPRGGKREGAGRKPGLVTVLERRLITSKHQEAEFAFALFVAVMRGEVVATAEQLFAAKTVMERVWGKPKQTLDVHDWRLEAEKQGIDPNLFFERLVNKVLEETGPMTIDGKAID